MREVNPKKIKYKIIFHNTTVKFLCFIGQIGEGTFWLRPWARSDRNEHLCSHSMLRIIQFSWDQLSAAQFIVNCGLFAQIIERCKVDEFTQLALYVNLFEEKVAPQLKRHEYRLRRMIQIVKFLLRPGRLTPDKINKQLVDPNVLISFIKLIRSHFGSGPVNFTYRKSMKEGLAKFQK